MTISRNLSILAEGVSASGVLAVTNGGTGVTTSTGTGSTVLSASPTLTGTLTIPTITSPAATAFTIQSAASTAITIDTSQNVGIGTSSPTNRLDVTAATGVVNVSSSTGTNYAKLQCNNAGGSYQFGIDNSAGTNFGSGVAYARVIWNDSASAPTIFYTNSTERARIDSSGNLLAGADNAYTCGGSGRRWSAIWAANSLIQTSDKNAKMDVIESPLGLDFINVLRPVAYKFKVGGNKITVNLEDKNNPIITPIEGKRQHFGLIAQEVKASLPEGVDFGGWVYADMNDPNSEQGLRYDEFISPLIKAIQELSAKNDALAARLAKLETVQ